MKHNHGPKTGIEAGELFEYRSVERKKLKRTIAITGLAMLVEIVGGILSNSLALLSDAGHMFTHFFALAISLGAIFCADLPVCHHRTYGFFRAEILAAFINSLFLFAATGWILYESIKRIVFPAPVLSMQMFGVALFGLVVNLISVVILHGSEKSDINVRSAFLHMLADTMSSVVVVMGAVLIYFTGWNIIDPVLSIGISLVILKWGWELFKESANILLESAPKGVDTAQINEALMKEIPAIEEITDLHIWTITSDMHSLTVHVKLRERKSTSQETEILVKIRQILERDFKIDHTTIELD